MYLATDRLIIRSIQPSDEAIFIEMASDGSLTEIFGDCNECHKWMGEEMEISIEPILREQKSVFVQMMELYMYDFSEFSDDDINEYGYFGYSRIDDYWNEEGRYPFFIRVNGKLAGLVLVRSCCEYNDLPNPHNIAEFFVMKKYRRKGVGKTAAMKVFDMFPGSWEVSQWTNNTPAQSFWKQVINEYTKGKYDTFVAKDKEHVGFTFRNA